MATKPTADHAAEEMEEPKEVPARHDKGCLQPDSLQVCILSWMPLWLPWLNVLYRWLKYSWI